jgi:hypothetical protein
VGWGSGGWKLWAAWARNFRTPSFDDLYGDEQFRKGNPDLEPETSESYDGGIGLALRSGPFRVALVLSLIVHLVLLVVIGWGRLEHEVGSGRRIPLMRVRLLSPATPVAVPAAPAIRPAAKQP